MGDWNVTVGEETTRGVIGKYGLGTKEDLDF